MQVLLATTDPVRLSFLMALLRDGGCSPVVLDAAISAVEGGIGIFPRRIAVPAEEVAQARRVLREAGEAEARMLTEDRLLGGRVRLRQPQAGLRAGHDAVLLAAAVPARPGERVLELGCGSGAAFLCLAARVPGIEIVAVEREPALAALARENAAINGLEGRVTVLEGDVADPALRRALPRCGHGFANPPFWEGGTAPPGALRSAATHATAPLEAWAACLAASIAHRGSALLVMPAARFADGLAALAEAGFGSPTLLPLWPRAGMAAKRVLLGARRGGRGPGRVLPGLALHGPTGAATPEAAAILGEGAALAW